MTADNIGKHGKLSASSAKIVSDAAIADSAKQMPAFAAMDLRYVRIRVRMHGHGTAV